MFGWQDILGTRPHYHYIWILFSSSTVVWKDFIFFSKRARYKQVVYLLRIGQENRFHFHPCKEFMHNLFICKCYKFAFQLIIVFVSKHNFHMSIWVLSTRILEHRVILSIHVCTLKSFSIPRLTLISTSLKITDLTLPLVQSYHRIIHDFEDLRAGFKYVLNILEPHHCYVNCFYY